MTGPLIDIFIIEDNKDFREMLEAFFTSKNLSFKSFESAESALRNMVLGEVGCVISDVQMGAMDGVEMTRLVKTVDKSIPIILITGYGSIEIAVKAVKAGATQFLEKPIDMEALYRLVMESLAVTEADRDRRLRDISIQKYLKNLTARERNILKLLATGLSNKEVGLKLDISYRTVEVHRAHIMEKLQAKSVVDLVHAADKL